VIGSPRSRRAARSIEKKLASELRAAFSKLGTGIPSASQYEFVDVMVLPAGWIGAGAER